MAAIPSLKWSRFNPLVVSNPLPGDSGRDESPKTDDPAGVGKVARVYRRPRAEFKENPGKTRLFSTPLADPTNREDK